MAKNSIEIIENTEQEVDGVVYTIEAWPATFALDFLEAQQENLQNGKSELSLMQEIICKSVSLDGSTIDKKRFDILFSRRTKHITKLYEAVLEYNLGDLFTDPDS